MRLAKFYTWLQRRVDALWMLPVFIYYKWRYRKPPRSGAVLHPAQWGIDWYNRRPRVCGFVKVHPMYLRSMTGSYDWLHTPDGFFMIPACAIGSSGPVEPDGVVRFANAN
jgi:hypothetical protein